VAEFYPRLSSLSTGLRCVCPRCGQGKIYQGVLRVRETCERCGLDLTRLSAEDGPAFFVIVVYSAIMIPLAVWVEFTFDPPIWLHIVIWLPVITVGSIALMRPLKAWLMAQHYKHNVKDHNQ